ncbi:Signal recognition particle receptor subunit alpha, partial [Teratosphaeria destructans]
MLDAFEIVTTSGIVLWRRHWAPISPSLINGLVSDVLIEDRQQQQKKSHYTKDAYTLKWTRAPDLGLVFVVGRLPEPAAASASGRPLLTAARALFVHDYAPALRSPHTTSLDTRRFDLAFDRLLQKLDTGPTTTSATTTTATHPPHPADPPSDPQEGDVPPPPPPAPQFKRPAGPPTPPHPIPTTAEVTPVSTPDTSRPATPSQTASHLLTAKPAPAKASRR